MMFRRAEDVGTDGRPDVDEPAEDDRPTGIDDLLEPDPGPRDPEGEDLPGDRPPFRTRMHGYDRLQVDNYVARTGWEIASYRRQADHLLDRFGVCSAELEISRRLLAQTPTGRELGPVSERVGEILRLAADEATQMIDAAAAEADRLLAEARLEADARLRKAHAIKEMAVAVGDDLREQARRDRVEATERLARAHLDAEELLGGAQDERDRLEAEARSAEERTEAAERRLAAVQDEVADLRRQRDDARSSLRRLTDQIGQVLQGVGPADLVGAGRVEPGVLTSAG